MNYHLSEVIVTNKIVSSLKSILSEYSGKRIFVLMDTNTNRHCWSVICKMPELKNAEVIVLESGEEHKSLESVVKVWKYLSDNEAQRSSLLINLGGGVICDMGGFAASTFKRGIQFINIPTTLLSQIDASVGGKTGFNFNGLKNEIGVINQPEKVILSSDFLKTLSLEDILSGYAEMLKHALIHSSEHLDELLQIDIKSVDYKQLTSLIRKSTEIKQEFVKKDPTEKNIRKVLNFGHTFGHAFESFALEIKKPICHGMAVALGIVGELYLSVQKKGFPKEKYLHISEYILENYNDFPIFTEHYSVFYEIMLHDKKNNGKDVNFTLLSDVGDYSIDNICTEEEIYTALYQYKILKER